MPRDLHTGLETTRIVLADDHAILRQSLRVLLGARPGIEIVGEAADGRDAIAVCEKLRPDVVLMDVAMPELNGIEATRRIRHSCPKTQVIIVSAFGDQDQLRDALRAGATGYVVKRSDIDELLLAIQMVRRGNTYFSADLAASVDIGEVMYQSHRPDFRSDADRLTPREREVLQLIAEGHTGRGIAERLFLSPKTVEGHKTRIMEKIGASNRSDLIRFALRAGMVTLEEGERRAFEAVQEEDGS